MSSAGTGRWACFDKFLGFIHMVIFISAISIFTFFTAFYNWEISFRKKVMYRLIYSGKLCRIKLKRFVGLRLFWVLVWFKIFWICMCMSSLFFPEISLSPV